MATITAQASGMFSSPSTWSGGVVPGVGDTANCSTFQVTVDDSRTVGTLSSGTTGYFILADGCDLTFTSLTFSGTNTYLFHCRTTTGQTATLNGNISISSSTNRHGVLLEGVGGTLVVNGNLSSTGGNNRNGVRITGEGSSLTVNGTLFQSSPTQDLIYAVGVTNVTINIVGDMVGNSSSTGYLIHASNTTSDIHVNITGDVTAGNIPAINIESPQMSSVVTVTGTVTASSTANAINCTSIVRVVGKVVSALGSGTKSFPGIMCQSFLYTADSVGPNISMFQNDHSTSLTLYEKTRYPNMPVPADVRKGTPFGITNSLIGTCSIPDAATVVLGVGVDATTGTGLVNNASLALEMWNTQTNAAFDSNSMGDRLSDVLTTSGAGQQLVDHGVGE